MNSKTRALIGHATFWAAAVATGLVAVAFARTALVMDQLYRHLFTLHPWLSAALTPVLFLLAAGLVRIWAPAAAGSGIPQLIVALHASPEKTRRSGLVAIRTSLVKWASAALAFVSGASAGREGPTVQLAGSVFWWFGEKARSLGASWNPRALLLAGGSAGVAAAFNTPLAGLTFALEELSSAHFQALKQDVILAVVLAGITARLISGDYLYFGDPQVVGSSLQLYAMAALIGILAGALGGLFAKALLAKPLERLAPDWRWRAILGGLICGALALATQGMSAGAGVEPARAILQGRSEASSLWMFPAKFASTLSSYGVGFAGGIFAPCLAMGASLGAGLSQALGLPLLQACGLLGMAAFFTAVVGAPLTSVVIVMEMTNEHGLILPLFIAAFFARAVSSRVSPGSLYEKLAVPFKKMSAKPGDAGL